MAKAGWGIRHIVVIVFITIGVGVGLFVPSLINIEPPPLTFPETVKGVVIESPARVLPEFSLVNQASVPFALSNLKDKWSLVFFGYTNCPDVCPTTMGTLDRVSKQASMPGDVQYLFVTVDPKRDTPPKLKEFIDFFKNDKFTALTGDKVELDKVTEKFGVTFDYEGDTNSKDYVVNHYAAVFIVDSKARIRAYVLPPHDVSRVSQVFMAVRNYYGE